MSTRSSAPTNELQSTWFLLALTFAGLLSIPTSAAERVVLGEEFSAAW